MYKKRRYIGFTITLVVGLILAGYLIEVFLDLAEELKKKDLKSFDNSVARFTEGIRSNNLTKFFKFVTPMGDVPFYPIALLIISLIIYKIKKEWALVIQTAVILSIATGLNFLLKSFINRARPDGNHLISVDTSSFPSGHAVSSIAFYGFLIYVVWRLPVHQAIKYIAVVLLIFIILMIGYSRIYLGVHFATDILAGYAVGGFCLTVFILSFYVARFFSNKNLLNNT